jgi:hypothetical protein
MMHGMKVPYTVEKAKHARTRFGYPPDLILAMVQETQLVTESRAKLAWQSRELAAALGELPKSRLSGPHPPITTSCHIPVWAEHEGAPHLRAAIGSLAIRSLDRVKRASHPCHRKSGHPGAANGSPAHPAPSTSNVQGRPVKRIKDLHPRVQRWLRTGSGQRPVSFPVAKGRDERRESGLIVGPLASYPRIEPADHPIRRRGAEAFMN